MVIENTLMLAQMHGGMKVRLAVCSLIYRKALRLSSAALSESTTAGHVLNLLSNDAARLELINTFLNKLWVAPLQTLIVCGLLYREIGPCAFGGVVFTLGLVPLQCLLGRRLTTLRWRTALMTDKRVRLMREIVNGMQAVRMLAYERPFGKLMATARR